MITSRQVSLGLSLRLATPTSVNNNNELNKHTYVEERDF